MDHTEPSALPWKTLSKKSQYQTCAVAVCKTPHPPETTLHRFPRDPNLRKAWKVACKRKDPFNLNSAIICSRHFKDECFERDLKCELMEKKKTRRLKQGSIPTENLLDVLPVPSTSGQSSSAEDRLERRERRKRKDLAKELLTSQDEEIEIASCDAASNPILFHEDENKDEEPAKVSREVQATCSTQDKQLQCRVEEEEVKALKQEVKALRQQLARAKKSSKTYTCIPRSAKKAFAFEMLKKSGWSVQQVSALLEQKTRAKWKAEDIIMGLTLRSLSRKAYEFLRRQKLLPLPSLRTLRRFVKDFQCPPGVQEGILQGKSNIIYSFLQKTKIFIFFAVIPHQVAALFGGEEDKDIGGKSTGGKRNEESLLPVVFSFDEMSVKKSVEFDQKEERVYGPFRNVQVGMIRGLVRDFKQPIYYEFDKTMDKDLVFKIVLRLKKTGLQVRAVVSDMGTKNIALWRQLNVTSEKPYFYTPQAEKINVFADTPHLLKLLRNHFLDQGYVLPGGKIFQKEDLLQLLNTDKGELRLCHKLKPLHFTCKGSQRQRVMLAAQLFSHSVASALRLLSPELEEQANFVDLVNSCFDIFNSRIRKGIRPLDCALGLKFEEQHAILCKAKEVFTAMRAQGKKSLLPWQKGWILNINSLLDLFSAVKAEYSLSYVLTTRLNQDCLENFFSRIRYLSGATDTRPGPVEFKIRFRNLILGQAASIIVENAAVQCEEDSAETLSVLLMKEIEEGRKSPLPQRDDESYPDVEEGKAPEDPEVQAEEDSAARELGGQVKKRKIGPPMSAEECSEEALKYVAGYLAFKLKGDFPHLATSGDKSLSFPPCPWIEQISYGGLTFPSKEWLEQVKKFEEVFKQFHGKDGISREKGIIQKIQHNLKEAFPSVPEAAIKMYGKTRTHIRIKYLRSQNVTADDTRAQKKMKDYVQ